MMRIPMLTICVAFFLEGADAQTIEAGKREYQARCAVCHGEDGTGGARGPGIVDLRRPRATSREAVRDLIRKGIPDRGMPAFSISDEELESIATYVLRLRAGELPAAPTGPANAPGDAAA